MISAVIITFNEGRNIGRCLASLHGVADEIIVVDSGSTDDTKWICQRYGVRWIEQIWRGYGSQKNAGNALATHPYILSIDADEAISEPLRRSILAIKPRMEGVYAMNRRTNYCGTWIAHGGWYPDTKVRLFPKNTCRWDNAGVHEKLEVPPSLAQTHLKGDLLHFSYYTVEEHRERQEKYAGLQAEKIQKAGKMIHIWHLMIKPVYTFLRFFVIRGGWRDGKAGWQIATISAWGTRRRYEIARELKAKKNRSNAPV